MLRRLGFDHHPATEIRIARFWRWVGSLGRKSDGCAHARTDNDCLLARKARDPAQLSLIHPFCRIRDGGQVTFGRETKYHPRAALGEDGRRYFGGALRAEPEGDSELTPLL